MAVDDGAIFGPLTSKAYNAGGDNSMAKKRAPQSEKKITARSTSCPYPTMSARSNTVPSALRKSHLHRSRHTRQPAISSIDDLNWGMHTIPEVPEYQESVNLSGGRLVDAENLDAITPIELDEILLPDSFSGLSVVDAKHVA
jgi:hypothetical protein